MMVFWPCGAIENKSRSSLLAKWVKDLALSLLWLGFDPWSWNFACCGCGSPLQKKSRRSGFHTFPDLFHFFLSFFFWLHLQHVDVPGPGIEPVPQQWPKSLQWQCWIPHPVCHKGTPTSVSLSVILFIVTHRSLLFGLGNEVQVWQRDLTAFSSLFGRCYRNPGLVEDGDTRKGLEFLTLSPSSLMDSEQITWVFLIFNCPPIGIH